MIGVDRQLDHRPLMFLCNLTNDLLQAVANGADEHLASPLGAPDDVVHDEVYVVPLMLIVYINSIPFFNTERKPERPFIPRLKSGAFLPHPG